MFKAEHLYLDRLAYYAKLGGGFDRDQLLIMARSSITLLNDRCGVYWIVSALAKVCAANLHK